jgi:hypothetical protein
MTKTIQLSEIQIEQVLEILDMQASTKIGCIPVVNFGFDRTTVTATVVGTGYLASSSGECGTDSHLRYLVFASLAL